MGNLRDQLEKAKILSDKEARRLAHKERVERKEKGRQKLEEEQQQRQEELKGLRDSERQRTRQEQAATEARRRREEEEAACRAILQNEARKPGPGTLRHYFVLPDGAMPCLELSPNESNQLRAGMLSIVRSGPPGTHQYKLLSTELARRVAKVFPEAVVQAPPGVVPVS